MVPWFAIFIASVALQRLWELRLAKRNAGVIRTLGGYEVGEDHYKYLVLLHVAFFLGVIAEFSLRHPPFEGWMIIPIFLFALLQAARIWCIRSLGVHWNTRIYVVPGMELVRKGPYRLMRHPNYAVVTLELLILPVIFACYWSAALFPLLNVLVLRKRIAVEEQALFTMSEATK